MNKKKLGTKKGHKTFKFSFVSIITASVILIILLGVSFFAGQNLLFANTHTPRPIPSFVNIPVCGIPGLHEASCLSRVVVNKAGKPQAGSSPYASSYGPSEFHLGYNLPCTPGGSTNANCLQPSSFGPWTIAIVDAYHTPTIENDLNVYSTQYNLPSCTKGNGCLRVLDQNGGNNLPTTVNGGWSLEASLDVQIAHAICQTCKIILFESNSSNFLDLATAVNTAASLNVTAISNSYGGSEWSSEASYDYYYNHPGIAVTVSSGDNGYGTEFPAASSGVVAVGGTTLALNSDNSYYTESIWNGSGSGCSKYESANSWQTNLSNWGQTGCLLSRGVVDVAADADPNTGASVYDSTPYNGATGWYQVGGTSLSSPIIAGVFALAGGVPSGVNATSIPYSSFNFGNSHDVVSGSNGHCRTIMCNGAAGYDGPTGLGSPNGVSGFLISLLSPTPTATPTLSPTLTPTPTSGPTPTATPTPISSSNPQISIIYPSDGGSVPRGSTVTIEANASDTGANISQVLFFVNGKSICSDLSDPYMCNWSVAKSRFTSYSITAEAIDSLGNTAFDTIQVTSE